MRILALDPGLTTGSCILDIDTRYQYIPINSDCSKLVVSAEELKDIHAIKDMIDKYKPEVIVFEEYRLYDTKASSKIGSDFQEVQLIGQIKLVAEQLQIPIHNQMAVQAKKFYTDKKLKELNLYKISKHVRDALRHALYFYDFNRKKVTIITPLSTIDKGD